MRKIMVIAAIAALSACNQKAAEPANDNVAAVEAPVATPAAFSVLGTTWNYTDPKTKKAVQESIDSSGNYITTAGADHFDHGTVVMKDGKACFTSAMNKEGEMCWTVADTAVGASTEVTSDKGEKLMVARVAFVPKTM